MEVAHRLSKLQGKCENIHGHSMWVELEMLAPLNENGIMAGLEFGDVKRTFRHFLDTAFDHHLLLNQHDPWAKGLFKSPTPSDMVGELLPGLQVCADDPTTENLAKWIGEWAFHQYGDLVHMIHVVVHETSVNMASWTVDCRGAND